MSDDLQALEARLAAYVGQPMGEPGTGPDPVNVPMVHHWVDAFDDRNPIYEDDAAGEEAGHGGQVAPPAMLQTWTMARPRIEGIAERGGSPVEMSADSPIVVLDEAGYVGTLATNSELEFTRYLRPGERVHFATEIESISNQKTTSLGKGFFLTWVTTYRDDAGEVVGRQLFRILKFDPSTIDPSKLGASR